MPPAVNRSALSLYAHRLVEDGCRFRLHASPEKSPFLYVREIVDGERLRQFSLAPLAKKTTIALRSNWPHPSFAGNFLPDSKTISERGFEARWSLNEFAVASRATPARA